MVKQDTNSMTILKADEDDLEEILQLQYLAYQSEARLLHNFEIPPLKQTIEEVKKEYQNGVILKAVQENKIIGSVRGVVNDGTLFVGKLMVEPQHQHQGIGSRLLLEIEKEIPHKRCELFTSTKSENNIRLYEKAGYRIFQEKKVSPELTFVYLEK